MDEYITIAEFLKIFKVTRNTFYNWKKKGLPYYTIGGSVRMKKEEVIRWIDDQQ